MSKKVNVKNANGIQGNHVAKERLSVVLTGYVEFDNDYTPQGHSKLEVIQNAERRIYLCDIFTAVDLMDWFCYGFREYGDVSHKRKLEISDRSSDVFIEEGFGIVLEDHLVRNGGGDDLFVGRTTLDHSTNMGVARIEISPDFESFFLEFERDYSNGNYDSV